MIFAFVFQFLLFIFSPLCEEVAVDYELSRLWRELKSTTSRGGAEADGVSGDFHLHCYIESSYMILYYIYIAHGYFTTIQIFDCVIMILCLHNNDDDGQVDVIENLVLAR